MQPRLWHAEESLPVKRYLMEYPALCQRRDALIAELERLRAATLRATARLDSVRVQTSRNPSSGEDAVLRVVDGEARLQEVIRHIGEALAARLLLLEALPDERQKTLLTLRYINGSAWERIGYTMHYERTQVFEIHNQALQAAQTLLDGQASPCEVACPQS